jgi:hypothetical protein
MLLLLPLKALCMFYLCWYWRFTRRHPVYLLLITSIRQCTLAWPKPARQVLLTTYNPLVLDGLDLRDDQIRLFAVERNFETGGAIKVHRMIVSNEIFEANQSGLSLSNLWIWAAWVAYLIYFNCRELQ